MARGRDAAGRDADPASRRMLNVFGALGRDLVICIGFYSRLPLGGLARRVGAWTMADFATAARLAPLAGLCVGAPAAGGLVLASLAGLPLTVAASLAVAILVLTSGALHEDGLADVADGFGGGSTRDRKLEIMRDSRIGTFGTLALVISLGLRIAAVAAVGGRSGVAAAAAGVLGASAASRGFGLMPLWALRAARPDGLAGAVGRLPGRTLVVACVLGLVLGTMLPVLAGLEGWRGICACLAGMAGSLAVVVLAARQIGGQTGDVAGAAQQISEIAYWLVLSLALGAGSAHP